MTTGPVGFPLLYVTGMYEGGLPGTSALSNLANPPSTAVAAEAASDARARAVGLDSGTHTVMQELQYESNDPVKDLADHQSIIQPS